MIPISRTILAVIVLMLSACASTPVPTTLLDEAEAAIRRAEAAGAVEHAPLELRFSREKLAAARLAIEVRRNDQAEWLAEESLVNSELAVAKAAAAMASEASRSQEEANRDLRADLESDEEGGL